MATIVAGFRESLGGFVAVENASASLAMFIVLAFEVVVAATLLDQVFSFVLFDWLANARGGGWAVVLLAASFVVALGAALLLARVG